MEEEKWKIAPPPRNGGGDFNGIPPAPNEGKMEG
jgi:hypothetical protein